MTRQASWTAEGRRAGREGRNPLHGANAPSVSWPGPSRLSRESVLPAALVVSPGTTFTARTQHFRRELSGSDLSAEEAKKRSHQDMRTLWTKAARSRRFIREVIAAGAALPLAAHHCPRPFPRGDRGIRPHIRLRRRRLQAGPCWCPLRSGHGGRCGQLSVLALSVKWGLGRTL